MVTFWMGVPITEVPRDELEVAFMDTFRQLEKCRDDRTEASIRHARDLAFRASR